jgi:hypothetical protein
LHQFGGAETTTKIALNISDTYQCPAQPPRLVRGIVFVLCADFEPTPFTMAEPAYRIETTAHLRELPTRRVLPERRGRNFGNPSYI